MSTAHGHRDRACQDGRQAESRLRSPWMIDSAIGLNLEDGQRLRSFARCADYYLGSHVRILQPMDIAILAPATKSFTVVVENNTAKAPKQYKRCIGHDWRDKAD